MNKNQNIAMEISLAVVAIMVGSAEIFGEKEIIFPEITAAMVRTIYPAVTSNGNSIIAVSGIIKGKVDIAQHGGK